VLPVTHVSVTQTTRLCIICYNLLYRWQGGWLTTVQLYSKLLLDIPFACISILMKKCALYAKFALYLHRPRHYQWQPVMCIRPCSTTRQTWLPTLRALTRQTIANVCVHQQTSRLLQQPVFVCWQWWPNQKRCNSGWSLSAVHNAAGHVVTWARSSPVLWEPRRFPNTVNIPYQVQVDDSASVDWYTCQCQSDNILSPSIQSGCLLIPRTKTALGTCNFAVAGSIEWNQQTLW